MVVIGAGFTGLSAAYELARRGRKVLVIEADAAVGGLAGSFAVGQTRLEKFYHHWFTNDVHVHALVKDIGREDQILYRATRTGSYYANSLFRLSRPMDLLRYTPLSLWGRIRLGLLVFQARLVRNWRTLEGKSASEWLIGQCGRQVYTKVWEPLMRGKFGPYADDISAVWFWNKLLLRGGSRSKSGEEMLAYYQGGFAALADAVVGEIIRLGGEVRLSTPATGLVVRDGAIAGVQTPGGILEASDVIATVPLPVFAELAAPHVSADYVNSLRRIKFLGNVCLTIESSHSLSDTYWINVADPTFPFVGLIEHTNFEPSQSYAGRHLIYLSKYLPTDSDLFRASPDEFLEFALPYIKRMFPKFDRTWVLGHHLYKAEFSQPVVEKHYSSLIPDWQTPIRGLLLNTMAQIYPEDRGTNYAIREGRRMAVRLVEGS